MKKLLFLLVGGLFFASYVFSQDLTVCGNSVDLTAEVENYTDFSWVCDNADGTFLDETSPSTTFTLASSAEYGNVIFHYTTIIGGEFVSNTVNVLFLQKPNPNAGADNVVCGLGGELNGEWGLPPSDGYTPACMWTVDEKPTLGAQVSWENYLPNDIAGVVHVSDYGIYTFILKEINTNGDDATCFNSDTVTIEFLQTPVVNAGPDFSVCGLDFHLNATSSYTEGDNITGSWSCIGDGTATFDDATSVYTTGDYSEYGSATFRWTEVNHPHISTENDYTCSDYDEAVVTFYEAPSAALNMNVADTVACGLTFEFLRAETPGDGIMGYWYEDNQTTQFGVGNIGVFNPETGVTVSSYGRHDFYWIVYSGSEENPRLCVDTAGPWTVNFIQQPSAQIMDEQIVFCGMEGQLHADFDGIGEGRWYGNEVASSDLVFDDLTDPNTIVHQTISSLYSNYTIYWRVQNTEFCTDEDSVRVEFARKPSAQISVSEGSDFVTPNAHVIFANTTDYGGIENVICEWYFGDGTSENNCDESVEHIYTEPDCYEPYLVVINSDMPQCGDTARLENCLSIAGIADFNVTDIDIYPSPVTDLLNITSSETISSIEIVNVMGQVVLQMDVNADNAVCNVEELANGVYVVRIRHFDKLSERIVQQKFVKE